METAARRYVRWVLTVHFALLVLVAAGVFFVSRELYDRTRQQAIEQARARHELIARQTARAIEGHYSAILADLNLLGQSKRDPSVADGLKGMWVLAPVLWNQMGQRVSHLLRIDARTMQVIATYPEDAAAKVRTEQILADSVNRDWLRQVSAPVVSSFRPATGGGYNLVAAPVPTDASILVAIVPFGTVQRAFLDTINEQDSISVTLMEDASTVGSAAAFPGSLGFVDQIPDANVRTVATKYLREARRGSVILPVPTGGYVRGDGNPLGRDDGTRPTAAGAALKERLFVIEPLNLPGKHASITVSSWLYEVDEVVAATFRRAMIGAGVILVVVIGIVVSTAVQLIRTRIRLERERHALLRREIDQARQIQLAWLPSADRGCLGACDIAAANRPASHVSGDFYDWFELDACRVAITIGDVTGHGMSAAFLMATTQLLVRTTLRRSGDPGACLEEVNRTLCGSGFSGQFVTMLVAVVDTERGEIEIASAGHYPPLVADGGALHALPMEGHFVLGVEPDVRYTSERFDLSPGASLLLYTDGVIEARSDAGEHFAAGRLRRALDAGHGSAQAMIDAVISAVDDFRGDRELQDDLTLVAVRLQPAAARTESLATAV